MITNDPILQLRLKGHPEMLARLAEFISMYGLAERPALILQARPSDPLEKDVLQDPNIGRRLTAGARDRPAWWHGFQTGTAVQPTFHGLAAISNRGDPTWASELHRDGHFIAGLWEFFSQPYKNQEVLCVPDFFDDAITDFFALVRKTLGRDGVTYHFTGTLCLAGKLYYLGQSDFGSQHVIRHDPLPLPHLQWPVVRATVGDSQYEDVANGMAIALAAAYGQKERRH